MELHAPGHPVLELSWRLEGDNHARSSPTRGSGSVSPECPATLPAGVREEGPGMGWRPALGTGCLISATSSTGTSTPPVVLSPQGSPREAQPWGEQLNHPVRWRSVLNPAQSWPALGSSLPALSLEDGPWEGVIQRCGNKRQGCKVRWF